MKKILAAAFFLMLTGAISCSSDPCQQGGGMGCGGSSDTANCNNSSTNTAGSNQCNSSGCNCKAGYHQVGSGSSAYCAKNQ
jgi:hypothetical protein